MSSDGYSSKHKEAAYQALQELKRLVSEAERDLTLRGRVDSTQELQRAANEAAILLTAAFVEWRHKYTDVTVEYDPTWGPRGGKR